MLVDRYRRRLFYKSGREHHGFPKRHATSGVTFGAIAIGCAVLCHRTYAARDDLFSDWK